MKGEQLAASNRTISDLKEQLLDVTARVPALKDRLEQSMDSYQAVREDLTEARARQAKLEARQKAMKATYDALVSGLKQQLDSQDASIEAYREKLKVSFVDRILFGFSQVRISQAGRAALDRLAEALSKVPEGRISIIGHADNVPVAPKFRFRFPSNWELSSARAGAVARYLLKQSGLDPARLEVIGLSRYHPVADNATEAGRAKNRRVEIIIMPNWPEGA
jgi:chemotaxis protein MotB